MFHTVYKTTNLVNGKYYFGYHKTKNPHDKYLGSGKYLRNAIAKYGVANFKKDVLFIYLDATSAFGKEAELVDAFRNDPLCMNLRQGGSGGFDWINTHGLATNQTVEGRERIRQSKLGSKRPDHVKRAVAEANKKRRGWHHSEVTKGRMSESGRAVKTPRGGQNQGVPHSEETKRRISGARRRHERKRSSESIDLQSS